MSIPRIQPLLLPVLRMTGDRNKHSVEEFRKRAIGNFKLSREEVKPTHSKSGKNVFVNREMEAGSVN
jgi:restriction endonuclease Mrr